jgi:hypothetical protein
VIKLPPRCERQTGVRLTLMYNACTIPRIIICPRSVVPGTHFCDEHQQPLSLHEIIVYS